MRFAAMLLSGAAALTWRALAVAQTQNTPAPSEAAPQNQAPEKPATPAEADSRAQGLGDIVVTAQRRAENSQRAAVAIDVIPVGPADRAGARAHHPAVEHRQPGLHPRRRQLHADPQQRSGDGVQL